MNDGWFIHWDPVHDRLFFRGNVYVRNLDDEGNIHPFIAGNDRPYGDTTGFDQLVRDLTAPDHDDLQPDLDRLWDAACDLLTQIRDLRDGR